MSDFTLEPRHTIVVGMTGSGKTTFTNAYALNVRPSCRFIFDDLNRVWPRLKLKPCYTARQCEEAVPDRWVCVEPSRMFQLVGFVPRKGVPTPTHAAFSWLCHWIYHVAQRGPGPKIVFIPEVWRFCTEEALPPQFALLAQAGRELGIELVLDTQRPEKLNPSLTGQCTELVCFRLASREALKAVKDLGADPDRVSRLPMGTFIAYNRLSGGELMGRVF